jgi:hypothetical protein
MDSTASFIGWPLPFFSVKLVQLKSCCALFSCLYFSKLEKIEAAAETFKFASSVENASPVFPSSICVFS